MPVRTGFNTNLYVVAATVLPVLFIALMLEGGGLTRAAIWALRSQIDDFRRLRARARQVAEAARQNQRPTVVIAVSSNADALSVLPAVVCMLLFGFGEVCSVLALNAQRATSFEHFWVIAALIAMPIAVVAVTSAAIIRSSSRPPSATTEAGSDAA